MDLSRYEYRSYPLAWAIIEDPITGEVREATREELVELGLTRPRAESFQMFEGFAE